MNPRLLAGYVIVIVLSFTAVSAVSAASYTITLNTNAAAYTGAATISISGQVSPAPGPNTAVLLQVYNPNNVLTTAGEAYVNGTTGLYNFSFVAGGSSWITGAYVVSATWGAYGSVVTITTKFFWSPTAITISTSTSAASSTSSTLATSATTTLVPTTSMPTSTTLSTVSSTTPQSSTLSSSSSSSSSSITSTPQSSSAVPEFPFQAFGVAILVALIVGSYVLLRRRPQVAKV